MTETKAIHPNPTGPIRAESPYQRKLERVKQDLIMLTNIAPELDIPVLDTIIAALIHLT